MGLDAYPFKDNSRTSCSCRAFGTLTNVGLFIKKSGGERAPPEGGEVQPPALLVLFIDYCLLAVMSRIRRGLWSGL